MGKLLLAIWVIIGSLVGAYHQPPAHPAPQLTASPSVLPTLMPTPTLAPGQIKAIYTFYIQATSHKITSKGLGLNFSDSGKTFTVDIGTFVDVHFGRVGKFHVSVSSPQDIFKCVGSGCLPHSSPMNSIFSSWVTRAGFGTIQVIEAK